MIRLATLKDLDSLVALEEAGFSSDRMSRRSYRHLLRKGHAIILIDEDARYKGIRSSCVLLLRQGSQNARLYSLVVAPCFQGHGLGKILCLTLEKHLIRQGYTSIFLEVHVDNVPAIKLYKQLGYEVFGMHQAYYADKKNALRMRKNLHG